MARRCVQQEGLHAYARRGEFGQHVSACQCRVQRIASGGLFRRVSSLRMYLFGAMAAVLAVVVGQGAAGDVMRSAEGGACMLECRG